MKMIRVRTGLIGFGIFLSGFYLSTVLDHQFSATAASPPLVNANIFVRLAKQVVPSVVNISTFTSQVPGGFYNDELFRRFFEDFFGQPFGQQPPRGRPRSEPKVQRPLSLGTGFIIDPEGYIITNNHVIGDAEEVKIKFTEDPLEELTPAEIIGKDPELDIALLKVKTKKKLVPLAFGDSDKVEVGEYVMAVGNPFSRGHSVTHGIISAKDREAPGILARYLQTDAPINPGNSGGPLVNLNGEVIGVNNAIDARAQGIGFSIPINRVKAVVPQLKANGMVERGFIGVSVNPLTPEIAAQIKAPKNLKAPIVIHVYEDEPADKAGIKPYDVITEFNGKPTRTPFDLIRSVTDVPIGKKVPVKVLRNGKERTLNVVVQKRQESREQQQLSKRRERSKKNGASDYGMRLSDVSRQLKRRFGLPRNASGVLVESVKSGGPAHRSGIREGDLIIEVNRKPIRSVEQFNAIVRKKGSYLVRIRRQDVNGVNYIVLVLDLGD